MPLVEKLRNKQAQVGIIGLGYAGLPMAVEIGEAGFRVVGLDIDGARVAALNDGLSPVSDVASSAVAKLRHAGLLRATTDFEALAEVDVAIICVPTPLTAQRQPDLRFVEAAGDAVARRLHRGMMVILQSTCAPGTTREVLLPRLAATGLRVGEDFHLVFAPERIDPGNERFTVRNTPKLVGGVTPTCTEAACVLFRQFINEVVPVSSPDVAEMSKLVENTFRFINISFINEMALLCDRLGINIWEVIEAASSKPFAFMPHYPSAGVGGHCIPVVPMYLEAVAQRHGMAAQLIEVSAQINDEMPRLVAHKVKEALAERGRPLAGARVVLLGITYKPNIADTRESAALRVLSALASDGAAVSYHDPLIERITVDGREYASQQLDPFWLRQQDCAVILTAHSTIDFEAVIEHAPLVVDTRNGLRPHPSSNVFNVWRPRAARVASVV